MISNEQYASSGSLMDFSGKESFGDIFLMAWQYSVSSFVSDRNHDEPGASLQPCWYRKCLKNYLVVDQLGNICIFISFVRI